MREKTLTPKSALSIADSMTAKGIAIILMLFHHLFNDYEEYAGYTVTYAPFTGDRLMYLAILSKICVAIFVFISGYGIASSFKKAFDGKGAVPTAELSRFVGKRYLKLMMGYWFAFALTFICQPLGRTIFDAYGRGLRPMLVYGVMDVLGLSFLFNTPTLNPTWWYMTVAIVIVVAVPFVVIAMRRFGSTLILAALLVLILAFTESGVIVNYMVTAVLGVWCHEVGVFDKIRDVMAESRLKHVGLILLEMGAFVVCMLLWMNFNYRGILDALAALLVLLLTSSVFGRVPLVSRGLAFLGKHSSNMFLMHNQLYSFYFLGFFYGFKYWLLILVSLVLASLLLSVVMEALKKGLGYNKLVKNI